MRYIFILMLAVCALMSCSKSSSPIGNKVNWRQSIEYKDAVINCKQDKVDSLNRIMNEKTKLVGVTFIQRQLNVIDIDEENIVIETILNN